MLWYTIYWRQHVMLKSKCIGKKKFPYKGWVKLENINDWYKLWDNMLEILSTEDSIYEWINSNFFAMVASTWTGWRGILSLMTIMFEILSTEASIIFMSGLTLVYLQWWPQPERVEDRYYIWWQYVMKQNLLKIAHQPLSVGKHKFICYGYFFEDYLLTTCYLLKIAHKMLGVGKQQSLCKSPQKRWVSTHINQIKNLWVMFENTMTYTALMIYYLYHVCRE